MGLARLPQPTLQFPDEFDPSSLQDEAPIVLYSSEHMSFFTAEALTAFRERVKSVGGKLEVVYFVRSITDA